MSVKEITKSKDFFFAESKKEVVIESNGKRLIFYANAISFFDNQNIAISSKGKNLMAMLVAASISDKDGNKFTYDEVVRLKDEFAKPFFDAALAVNARAKKKKK